MSYGVFRAMYDFMMEPDSIASEDTQTLRRSICDSCEVRNETADICTACGCFIPFKIKMKRTECPMLKWESEKDDSNEI